jgi:hypothetical protein
MLRENELYRDLPTGIDEHIADILPSRMPIPSLSFSSSTPSPSLALYSSVRPTRATFASYSDYRQESVVMLDQKGEQTYSTERGTSVLRERG